MKAKHAEQTIILLLEFDRITYFLNKQKRKKERKEDVPVRRESRLQDFYKNTNRKIYQNII